MRGGMIGLVRDISKVQHVFDIVRLSVVTDPIHLCDPLAKVPGPLIGVVILGVGQYHKGVVPFGNAGLLAGQGTVHPGGEKKEAEQQESTKGGTSGF